MSKTILTPEELAERWSVHPRSLQRMRAEGRGPKWFKVSESSRSNVRYRLSDIEEWEIGNDNDS